MNHVIIPVYNRPEFLEVTLDCILAADNCQDYHYVFAKDHGYHERVNHVIRKFPLQYSEINTPPKSLGLGKQSYNVLNAYMAACKHGQPNDLVFLIEDDIFIGKDFFRFHEAVHAREPNVFCVIGTANHNTAFEVTSDVNAYYTSRNYDYQSWGVSWRVSTFLKYIAPHFNHQYFVKPSEYCQKHFPNSRIGHGYVEQDGLIRRILEKNNLETAFPHVPRGFHGGYYSYHRGKPLNHTAEMVRRIAFDVGKLRDFVDNPDFITDSNPVPLDTSFTTMLHVPCRRKLQ